MVGRHLISTSDYFLLDKFKSNNQNYYVNISCYFIYDVYITFFYLYKKNDINHIMVMVFLTKLKIL